MDETVKKLLLVVDVEGWAWWWMAQGIAKYAPPEYDVQVITNQDFHAYTNVTPGLLMNYDGICQFSWVESTTPGKNGTEWNYTSTVVASHGLEFDFPHSDPDYLPGRISTRLRNRYTAAERLRNFDRVICVSPRLQKLSSEFNRNSVFCMPGVDHEIYKPPEQKTKSDKLRIGWSGQRTGRTKGFLEVLSPLMEQLGHEKYEWHVNDRTAGDALSQSEMVSWYQGLDLFLSTSCSEGCQMPIMESMACGVPAIATYSGLAKKTAWTAFMPGYSTKGEVPRCVEWLGMNLREYTADSSASDGKYCRAYVAKNYSWRDLAARWCQSIAGEELS